EHHHGPTRLTVADDARASVGVGVQVGDLLEEVAFGASHVLERLTRFGVSAEADEVARVTGAHGDADLAVDLEAADARPVSGARIEDDERAFASIDRHPGRRHDAYQEIVDRPIERPPVQDHLVLEDEQWRLALVLVIEERVTPLPHDVPEEDRALAGIDPVVPGRSRVGEPRIGYRPRSGAAAIHRRPERLSSHLPGLPL